MTLAALSLWAGLVLGFAYGLRVARRRAAAAISRATVQAFARGFQVGQDDIANAYLQAEMDAPDLVERSWPAARASRLPS